MNAVQGIADPVGTGVRLPASGSTLSIINNGTVTITAACKSGNRLTSGSAASVTVAAGATNTALLSNDAGAAPIVLKLTTPAVVDVAGSSYHDGITAPFIVALLDS